MGRNVIFGRPWTASCASGFQSLGDCGGEDASPDGTRGILQEYQERDPQHIRLFLRERNLGATRNLYEVLQACQGRYIALLEGDDYWTDPDKLQKQVEYLDSHPEAVACTHRCLFVDQHSRPIPGMPVNAWFYSGDCYTFADFCRREMPGQIGTLAMRNIFLTPGTTTGFYIAPTRLWGIAPCLCYWRPRGISTACRRSWGVIGWFSRRGLPTGCPRAPGGMFWAGTSVTYALWRSTADLN